MKDLKKRLNLEMDERINPMSDKLKSYSINKREASKPSYGLRWGLGMSLTAVLCAVIIMVFMLKPGAPGIVDTESLNSYYVVEINPTILVEVDSRNKIVSLKSGNSDADSFLIDLHLEGEGIDKGMSIIADEAMRLGYFKPTAGGALRISTIGGEDNLRVVKEALEDSFMASGYYVAIVDRVFDIDELNQKLNACYSSFDAYYERLKERSFMNNEISGDIASYYRDNNLSSFLFKEINDNLDKLSELKALINNMYNQYYKIRDELSIPSFIQDYWYLVNTYYKDSVPEDSIKLELDLMEEYLNRYESMTGDKITSIVRLKHEYTKLELANVDLLRGIVDDMESFARMLESSFSYVIGLVNETLNLLPSLDEVIAELTSLPTTIEEYYYKLNMIERNKRNDQILNNKDIYNSDRDVISDSEYASFIDQVIIKFGSVENYFKNNK